MSQRQTILTLLLFISLLLHGCSDLSTQSIKVASTTSTYDTGLWDMLVPHILEETGIRVSVIAVGSGKALKLLERGDVDASLTHAPKLEKRLIDSGNGLHARAVMFNYFLVAGPLHDPARVADLSTPTEVFRAIRDTRSPFLSRGDHSGTHQKEMDIWKSLGQNLPVKGHWYIQSGSGMATTIEIAFQKHYYTLSDQATLITHAHGQAMHSYLKKHPSLLNVYTYIESAHSPHQSVTARLGAWLVSQKTQKRIQHFTKQTHQLFYPIALQPS